MARKRNVASTDYLEQFSSRELEGMHTLAVGQAEDLKHDDGKHRWWIDRVGPESGATHRVSVEELMPSGVWRTVHEYEPYASMNPCGRGKRKTRKKGSSRSPKRLANPEVRRLRNRLING